MAEDMILFDWTGKPGSKLPPRDKNGKKKVVPAQTSLAGPSEVGSTPVPTTPNADDGSPAWRIDDADREPIFVPPPFPLDVQLQPIDFAWLRDARCTKLRIPVRQVCSKEGGRYSTSLQDVEEVSEDGKRVKLRFIRKDIWLDWDEVRPLRPIVPPPGVARPLVTPIRVTNPHFGQVYILSKIVDGHVKLRLLGQKNVTKKNPELDCTIEECVVVSSIKKVT